MMVIANLGRTHSEVEAADEGKISGAKEKGLVGDERHVFEVQPETKIQKRRLLLRPFLEGEIQMTRSEYVVVIHEGAWKISLDGQRYGPYPSKRAAVRAAVYAAYRTGQKGHFAQVLVQEKNLEVKKEWTFGDDAYPLRGAPARPAKAYGRNTPT